MYSFELLYEPVVSNPTTYFETFDAPIPIVPSDKIIFTTRVLIEDVVL